MTSRPECYDSYEKDGSDMVELSAFIGPALSALCAFIGSYFAFSTRLTKVETMLQVMEQKQDKHNDVIERTYKLESDVKTVFVRLDELREEVHGK